MYRNFDAFANDDVTKTPHKFTFKGNDYTFPSDIPYFTKLRMARLFNKGGKNAAVAGAELYDLLLTILGEEQLSRLEASAPDDHEGDEILKYIFDAWNGVDGGDGESDPKNEKVQRGKARR